MRPTHRPTAALQLLQHDHTSPGHRASRSAIVMLTGMTPHATPHVRQSSRRTAHHAVQVICRPATHRAQHDRHANRRTAERAPGSINICTAMILPRKNGVPAHAGLMARSPVGAPVAEWPSRLSQNESGTHFSPLAAKRQKQTPHIGRTAPLTTAEPHLKHHENQQHCYNGRILHAVPSKRGPPHVPGRPFCVAAGGALEHTRPSRAYMRSHCASRPRQDALWAPSLLCIRTPVALTDTTSSIAGISGSHLHARRLHDSPVSRLSFTSQTSHACACKLRDSRGHCVLFEHPARACASFAFVSERPRHHLSKHLAHARANHAPESSAAWRPYGIYI